MRVLKAIAIGAICLYGVFLGTMYWLMTRPPVQFAGAIAKMPGPLFLVLPFQTLWFRARDGALDIGAVSPDFELPTLDKKASVRLSAFRGKQPVVLIFGSYT
jgi:hypothetical protein